MNIIKAFGRGFLFAATICYLAFDLVFLCTFVYNIGLREVFSDITGWFMLITGYLALHYTIAETLNLYGGKR